VGVAPAGGAASADGGCGGGAVDLVKRVRFK
jgi:hypothetical protein